MDMQLLANVGMMCLVIGTLPSIYRAIKDRNTLSGFSITGALAVLFGQFCYTVYFWNLEDFVSSVLTFPLLSYWILVVVFSIRRKVIEKGRNT